MLSSIDNWLLSVFTTLFVIFANLLFVSAKPDSIRINVYFEPQNTETKRFFDNELVPLFQETSISERINLKLIPFGRAICNAATQDYTCTCTRGADECNLMHLMSCTLHDYRHHEDALEMIACIQGRANLDEAQRECIRKLPDKEAKWLESCPNKFRGHYLSWINGLRTKALDTTLSSLPLIIIDGKVTLQSTDLRTQICKHMESSKLKEC